MLLSFPQPLVDHLHLPLPLFLGLCLRYSHHLVVLVDGFLVHVVESFDVGWRTEQLGVHQCRLHDIVEILSVQLLALRLGGLVQVEVGQELLPLLLTLRLLYLDLLPRLHLLLHLQYEHVVVRVMVENGDVEPGDHSLQLHLDVEREDLVVKVVAAHLTLCRALVDPLETQTAQHLSVCLPQVTVVVAADNNFVVLGLQLPQVGVDLVKSVRILPDSVRLQQEEEDAIDLAPNSHLELLRVGDW